ncbi:hypothetical protein I308_103567 [Cryptococcus tetragattii IND107]|uniref:Allergen n=1 Tax=Cryptococcus tetragattii IND107 TaxID=1296105 RepID=A0ABR3BQN6_9TREE|nr:allergen [Cryptococcus tetragattii IND107]
MSSVTQGVKEFFSKSGKPETTEVCTDTAPEVVQEHIRPQEHVETAEAVDRERHVHHLQHRIQPVEDHQTLNTKHVNATEPVITREHKEEMRPEHQEALAKQKNLAHDTRSTGAVEKSGEHVGAALNEHQHHHIHETIQPVVQRETVEPTVVHQTKAIHEKVEDAPVVHEVTTLPTISAEKYSQNKSSLEGEGAHCSTFEGAPQVAGQSANVSANNGTADSISNGQHHSNKSQAI